MTNLSTTYPLARRVPSIVVASRDQLFDLVDRDLEPSEWHEVDQARINAFAAATGDHQWIHVDPERAATGPFGSTVAHGYLTLSLVPSLLSEVLEFDRAACVTINYGVDRVRFPSPLLCGSHIRLRTRLASAAKSTSGTQAVFDVAIDADGQVKPVLVASLVWIVQFSTGVSR